MDKNLVTQGEFAAYLKSHPTAMPKDTWHFLGQGTGDVGCGSWDWSAGPHVLPKPHPGNESLPVTYIGLDEARAYCKAVGKRLPHDEEWQYAGQGADHTRATPWGPSGATVGRLGASPPACDGTHCPKQQSGPRIPGPEPVGKYSPKDLSPFGVADLLGNVWQMTDGACCPRATRTTPPFVCLPFACMHAGPLACLFSCLRARSRVPARLRACVLACLPHCLTD